MHPLSNLNDFLVWLGTGGGAAVAVAFILERIPQFKSIPSANTKSLITLLCMVVLALGSYAVLTYAPKEVLDSIAPIFAIIAGVFGTWLSSQVAHAVDPARRK